ncbi:MAG: cation transport ATPase [Oleispira sp.]|jgi:cation transport ATPase|uniref:Co/Zn/Cd efflux system component n=1 Tax=Oleispira antarctica RB-8 TaxID=698738 RepID=R4YSM1_OLEAN|nr:cation transporter [Oleispira antarctica]CCK77935.1 Co/Zn/Cd efflux system component [Oleispira antarctica RB-8]|tara:strand:+ start:8913 stop:9812 length:900 start_codon:yes stop_codon:yes gene_type:complete
MNETCNGPCQKSPAELEINTPEDNGSFDKIFTSEYNVPKMDCPSEERLIRLIFDSIEPPVGLLFDIPERKVRVFHDGNLDEITLKIESLGFGAKLSSTQKSCDKEISKAKAFAKDNEAQETRILMWLLVINASMFMIEIVVGWTAQSAGLIADSLDMFADAAVYGMALFAVGHSIKMKLRAAHLSGWLQLILALGALSEVLRRFVFGSEPVSTLMMGFGLVALIANVTCLMLIFKNKEGGAHMKASWIFSANDVIANLGVILAGFLVAWTGSRYPDLVVGLIIGVIVLNGSRRILQLKS